jgi:hypothetical protein
LISFANTDDDVAGIVARENVGSKARKGYPPGAVMKQSNPIARMEMLQSVPEWLTAAISRFR